jgi:hypothetical protein
MACGLLVFGSGATIVYWVAQVLIRYFVRRPAGFPLTWHLAGLLAVAFALIFGGLFLWLGARLLRETWSAFGRDRCRGKPPVTPGQGREATAAGEPPSVRPSTNAPTPPVTPDAPAQ